MSTTTFTIPPVALPANTEGHSAGVVLPANITSAEVQIADSAGNTTPQSGSNWLTVTGDVNQWGIQMSTDGGVTWFWFLYQQAVPFGALGRDGQTPRLRLSSSGLVGQAGNRLRLAVLVDAAITLGAVVRVTT